MLDRDEFKRWRTDAAQALASARLQIDGDIHNWACFLCEQAAQFALKALLHGLGRGAWGHDLLALGDSVSETVGSTWEERLRESLARLARHYIPARYPDAHAGAAASQRYTPADSAQAVADTSAVLTAIDALWAGLEARSEEGGDEA